MNLPIYFEETAVLETAEHLLVLMKHARDDGGRAIVLDPSKGSTLQRETDPSMPAGDAFPEVKDLSKAWCLASRHIVQTIADIQRVDVKIFDRGVGLKAAAEHYDDKYLLRCFS